MHLGRRRVAPYRTSKPQRNANALTAASPPDQGSLTASGKRIERADIDTMRRLQQAWQVRAFSYYDLLGEIKFAAQFYARMLAPLRLYAAEINDAGDVVETTNEQAKAALARIQDPGGGRKSLQAAYGRLMFITGEGYLFVTLDEDGVEQWEMLSTDELKPQSGSYVRYRAPQLGADEYKQAEDGTWEPVAKTAIAYRLWKRHPRFSQVADATMQGVLDLCEELVLLTQAVRARARSRLAGSGILFIDDKIAPAPSEPVGDEDALDDPWLADLIEAMTSPIVDEGSASAVVPLVTRVSVPDNMTLRDMVYHLQLVDPTQLYPETGLREECIKRIAIGLDMPPEILLGLQDSNHWTAWAIDEQTWKAHGEPIATQLVDDLSAAFLRPELRAKNVEGWQRYCIAYDATAIVNHPDRTKDAKELYDRGAIGLEALREAAGFDKDDAPTEQDRAERIGILTRDSSLAWFGVPSPKATLEPVAGELETATGTVSDDPTASGAETAKEPPGSPTAPEQPTVIGAARIMGAADLALLRAREAAGNRLRTLVTRGGRTDKAVVDLIDGVPAGQVAAVLGRERVRELKAPADAVLVAGARGLVVDALRVWGITDKAVVDLITRSIETHAARTLYDERPGPMPTSFGNYVQGVTVLTS